MSQALSLSQAATTVAAAAAACTGVRVVVSAMASAGWLSRVDAPPHKIGAMAVSTLHALSSSLHALYMVKSASTVDDFGARFGVRMRLHCLAELGYYVYDTAANIRTLAAERRAKKRQPSILDVGFLIHHLPPLAGFGLVVAWWQRQPQEKFNSTGYLTAMCLVVHITTPLQNLRWVMDRAHVPVTSAAYRANQVVFLGSFTVLRIVGVFWLIRSVQWLRGLPADISTLALVREHMPIKCVVGTAVLYAVNVVWWGMNTNRLVQSFSGSERRKPKRQ
uniref:TLC domain-containing protein n=1 Tax=Neobodo designis TaxID=312471 RepID=A0A7S1QJ21_NEODS|mmetsp:Transcript_46761/g.144253  ORF Transcript_46761/g.144253 Transcript_46761/m.144253 type:complete len:277 (+) Transcript_46761:43-873(+)